ncbi:FAD dependent oxidoreductase [Cytidiella melzeri]|nr:FAD dependent oxidoreductase [Cytidiella melzeri]
MPTTVILGTGIIGLSTAYYLSLISQKHEIHLVESSPELFASASGKAAGFLAKDWFTPAVMPLGEFSFDLHRKLAEQHDGHSRWGYSGSTASVDPKTDAVLHANGSRPTQRRRSRKHDYDWLMQGSSRLSSLDNPSEVRGQDDEDDLPRWLHAKRRSLQVISDRTTTGQVDPYPLCQFLLQQCRARGVKLHQPAHATELQRTDCKDPSSKTSIRLEYLNPNLSAIIDIPCDSIVIAAGCWTPRVYKTLFPNAGRIPRVTALAGHSVVLRTKRWPPPLFSTSVLPPSMGCHAVFTNDAAGYSPEIFSRSSGDVWLGGYNSSHIALPKLATESVPQPDSISVLVNSAKALCGEDVEVVKEGLCFRPVVPTGRPVIAQMHEADLGDGVQVGGGVFVATGHGPWGITLSLGTGYVVGEMVLGRETSVDVKALSTWEAQAV